jgi:phosphoglycolate phosphatase
MNMAKRREHGLRRALDAGGVGNVAQGAADIRSDLLKAADGGRKRVLLDIGEHHLHAGLRERLRHRQPDPGGPAGHKGCPAGKFTHLHSLPNFARPYLHEAVTADSEFKMTLPRTLVFDLDGTLVDTAPDLIAALNFVLVREGLPPLPMNRARNMIGAGARKMLERGLEAEGRAVSVEELDKLTKDFIGYYADHIAEASRPFEGLEAALDDLQGQGFQFAVCTNKLEWLSKRLLDQLGMSARFAAICGADTFGVAKPDPVILQQTLARAGGHLASAIMVGDAGPDVGVARRAGIPVIGVEFGYTEVPIAELKPDRLIGHFRDLSGAVHSLIGAASRS